MPTTPQHDLDAIRAEFPALTTPDDAGQQPLFLDGPGGAQVPQVVLDAMVGYLGRYNSNFGGYADAGRRTSALVTRAREAASDWLGAPADGIVFGLNTTSLAFNLSRAVAQTWRPGQNVVVTELDHYAHVSSWQRAAEDAGVEVRTLTLDAVGVDLDYAALDTLVDENTAVVAVTGASNVLGTIPDVPRIAERARAVGALVSVDAVHAAVHLLQDAAGADVDFLFASAYKLGGPHVGVLAAKPEHLRDLRPYKVEPATEVAPARWEQGTQSFEGLAGLAAMVDYWASLGWGETRRERLASAYAWAQEHEGTLTDAFLAGVAARPHLRLYGRADAEGRTPTFAFNVLADGEPIDALPLVKALGERNVALGQGNFYALGGVRRLGLAERGVLRAGFVHYNTVAEVERFFALLDELLPQALPGVVR